MTERPAAVYERGSINCSKPAWTARASAIITTIFALSLYETLQFPWQFLDRKFSFCLAVWSNLCDLAVEAAWLPIALGAALIFVERVTHSNALLVATEIVVSTLIGFAMLAMNGCRSTLVLPLTAFTGLLAITPGIHRFLGRTRAAPLSRVLSVSMTLIAVILYRWSSTRHAADPTMFATVVLASCAILVFCALPFTVEAPPAKVIAVLTGTLLTLSVVHRALGLVYDFSEVEHGAKALTPLGRAVTRTAHKRLLKNFRTSPIAMKSLADSEYSDFLRLSGMPAVASSSRANLLLVTVEAVRFDKTSLADPDLGTTPALLEFADSGAFVFSAAHSPGAKTLQTMASLLTMSFPSSASLDIWSAPARGELRSEATTVAEIVKNDGYETWMVSHDMNSSFHRLQLGLNQGFPDSLYIKDRKAGATVDQLIADASIERLRRSKRTGAPFFGWVFLESPHDPYETHYADMANDTPLQRYLQEVRNSDTHFGRIVAELKALNLIQNTIVLFMADHGEEFGEHGAIGHLSLHRECTHVPFVAWMPGSRGSRLVAPTSTAFALPWAMGHLGETAKSAARAHIGRYLLPLLRAVDGAVLSELMGPGEALFALTNRRGNRTICNLSTDWCQLYRADDLKEETDLSLSHHRDPALANAATAYRRLRPTYANYRFEKDRGPSLLELWR